METTRVREDDHGLADVPASGTENLVVAFALEEHIEDDVDVVDHEVLHHGGIGDAA